jgi:hypothetical protein
MVGAAGGTVTAPGVSLDIPAGALPSNTMITVTNVGGVPAGYVGLSPLFQFGPEGTVFQQPVTVHFTLSGGTDPAVFWSNAQGGYDELTTTTTATTASATVMHFSRGFCGESHDAGGSSSGSSSSGGSSGGASSGSSGGSSGSSSGSSGSSGGSSSGSSGQGADSGAADDGGTADGGSTVDGSAYGVTVTIDGTPKFFGYNVTATALQSWWVISANDGVGNNGGFWNITLSTPMTTGATQCLSGSYPSINYSHYAGLNVQAPDTTFTTQATGAQCVITETTNALEAGTTAVGTFSGHLIQPVDSGNAPSHSFTAGSYDVIVP